MTSTIKKRADLVQTDTWRLEDIFATDEAWEAAYQACRASVGAFSGHQGALGARDGLMAALDDYHGIARRVGALYAYAKMRRDEDNNRTRYQALTDRAASLSVEFSTAAAFMTPELVALPPAYLAQCAADPAFRDYRMFFTEIERARPHTLSAAEERIVAMAGELGAAPGVIFDMLTDADMKFPEVPDGKGGMAKLTHGSYIHYMMSGDRAVRKAAFTAMYETFKRFSATVPAVYAASVKGDLFAARTAGSAAPSRRPSTRTTLPLAVYDSLVERCAGTCRRWTISCAFRPGAWAFPIRPCTTPTPACRANSPSTCPSARPTISWWRRWPRWARTTRRCCAGPSTSGGSTPTRTRASPPAPIPGAPTTPIPTC